MGASPWEYFTEYDPDLNALLQRLRRQEFEACNYFGDGSLITGKGPRHASIELAMEAADADGTAPILDIELASTIPFDGENDPGVAHPLSREQLIELFATDRPSQEDVEGSEELYELIGRGCCIYVLVYNIEGGPLSGVSWVGYSYD